MKALIAGSAALTQQNKVAAHGKSSLNQALQGATIIDVYDAAGVSLCCNAIIVAPTGVL